MSRVGRENIPDPVGLSAKAYCEAGDKIADALVPLLVALTPAATPGDGHWGRPPLTVGPSTATPLRSPLIAAQHTGWYAGELEPEYGADRRTVRPRPGGPRSAAADPAQHVHRDREPATIRPAGREFRRAH
ncbi:hypothetical protein [Nocardia sp. NBC_01329]|uniref:hypothetical protein n=1 Tax=Nocardia sp. NBC_01329 TaxID=2903594 RepID=UPI002E1016B8|nr:hypothetical protein OG405_17190 [Nocardia sp. NBC_01329]